MRFESVIFTFILTLLVCFGLPHQSVVYHTADTPIMRLMAQNKRYRILPTGYLTPRLCHHCRLVRLKPLGVNL